jgi:hypothetical protein
MGRCHRKEAGCSEALYDCAFRIRIETPFHRQCFERPYEILAQAGTATHNEAMEIEAAFCPWSPLSRGAVDRRQSISVVYTLSGLGVAPYDTTL